MFDADTKKEAEKILRKELEALLEEAEQWGFVVTVEQLPLYPLAMGHHETYLSIREAREMAEVLCVDEGCDHHGTKHICIDTTRGMV